MSERTPSGALTVEEIRRLHVSGLAGRRTRAAHLETLDGKLACKVKREPDSRVTTEHEG